MKKKLLSIIVLFFLCLSARATHIVGGEIQLQVLKNQLNLTHRLSLNLYFDDVYGNKSAKDANVTLAFFRKKDNFLMGYAVLPLINEEIIGYSNPKCVQQSFLVTRYIQYSNDIYLNPNNFNDPEGYYVVWERCCRNNAISNIINPQAAGSEFYLAFPPVMLNGKAFDNSSPNFVKLKGDYICKERPFSFDFGATDADGDSLAYRLVTPFNGFATSQIPIPSLPTGSSDYPVVRWQTGFGLSSVIPGSQPLQVNAKTGQLTVTSNMLGLFVFCVLTEEYRKGVKIGEVRRDFQLMVVDCPTNKPPVSYLREKGKTDFYTINQVVRIKANEKKCLNLLITDPDLTQLLTIKALPINFKGDIGLSATSFASTSEKDTLRLEVCFDECTDSFDGKPLSFDLIVADNGCPQALSSTLRINVFIEPLLNNKPVVSTDLLNRKGQMVINQTLKFNVFGTDTDNDNIVVTARGRGFSLASVGMNFAGASGVGKLTSPFTWTPTCSVVRNDDYIVDFILTDTRCGRVLKDSISVNLKALPIDSHVPMVNTSLALNDIVIVLKGTDPQTLTFDVISQDIDADPIKLYAQPKGFELSKVGMVWTDKDGVAKIVNPFTWKIDCSQLNGKDQAEFFINFITEDNSCNPNRFDTVAVKITLKNNMANYDTFKPANVFTPNGDDKNETFAITDIPDDNCFEKFENIQIFNRWGTLVFESTDKNFKWTGGQYASAEYYYLLKFSKREIKGFVNLIR
jgi:gliding motility-associated-like protein